VRCPARVLGVVVRSPVSVLTAPRNLAGHGQHQVCALEVLGGIGDCFTKVAASGRGPPLVEDLNEHPAIRVAVKAKEASTASRRRRVCIPCIVEGAGVRTWGRGALQARVG